MQSLSLQGMRGEFARALDRIVDLAVSGLRRRPGDERPGAILNLIAPIAVALIQAIVCAGCSHNTPSGPPDAPPPKGLYSVPPPAGKLPWPLHNPAFSQEEYDAMMHRLFIINNFGEYQEGQTKNEVAFHDGMDIVVAENGTKLYAVESGYVKAINSTVDGYKHIIIGDTEGSLPGKCWLYAHTDDFQYKVGEHVSQGAFLAVINFIGLPHVHLNRGSLVSGSWENYADLSFVQPDTFFSYEDTDPPVIETPFRYFRNNSDSVFKGGMPTIVSGDVDIVVGMRDAGSYAHSRDEKIAPLGYGDRLCVSRVEYELTRQGTLIERRNSFDLSRLTCRRDADWMRRALVVFKYRPTVTPVPPSDGDKVFSYYIVTNANPQAPSGNVTVDDMNFAWNTTARDGQGALLYPDGVYGIKVTAYDSHGNSAWCVDSVFVKNNPSFDPVENRGAAG